MGWSRLALALAVVALPHASAVAQPTQGTTVVFFGDQDGDAGFVSALKIQLAGVANVEVAAPLPVGDTLARSTAALAELRGRGAKLALWFQLTGGSLVLHAQALEQFPRPTEVGRADNSGTTLDRELALKVSAMVDSLLVRAARPVRVEVDNPPVAALKTSPTTEDAGAVWAMVLVTGGGASLDAGSPNVRGGPALSIGFGRSTAAFVIDGTAGVRWFAPRSVPSLSDSATLSEWSANSRVDIAFPISRRISLGPSAEVGMRWASARAETSDGVIGESRRATPYLAGGGLVRAALGRRFDLDAAVFATASLVREEFTVRGAPIAENSWARVGGRVSLRLSLP